MKEKKNIILENAKNIIAKNINHKSRVLDLGCGTGDLLIKLKNEKNVQGVGIEINSKNVIECVSKGLTVCQCNIDEALIDYEDNSFDYIIINNTLQQIYNLDFVMKEMLRVGKKIIVGMANFTFWKIRFSLLLKGKLPITTFYKYQWYNTPNIRLISVKDFQNFCIKHNSEITNFYGSIKSEFYQIPFYISNILSKYSIFICQKKGGDL